MALSLSILFSRKALTAAAAVVGLSISAAPAVAQSSVPYNSTMQKQDAAARLAAVVALLKDNQTAPAALSPALNELIEFAKKARDEHIRNQSVSALIEIVNAKNAASTGALDALVTLGNSPHHPTRNLVAFYLHKLDSDSAADPRTHAILRRLTDDNTPGVRIKAYDSANSLAQHGSAIAALAYELLRRGLKDADDNARASATANISSPFMAPRDELAVLLEEQIKDPADNVRLAARRTLVGAYLHLGRPAESLATLNAMAIEPNYQTRMAAAYIACDLLADLRVRANIVPMLNKMTTDPDHTITKIAAACLVTAAKKDAGLIPDALRALPAILTRSDSSGNNSAMESLAEIAKTFPAHTTAIIDAIASSEAYAHKSAHAYIPQTIGDLGAALPAHAPHAFAALEKLMKSGHPEIRSGIAEGLSRLVPADPALHSAILTHYIAFLNDPDINIARQTSRHLQNFSTFAPAFASRIADSMIAALARPEPDMRTTMVEDLPHIAGNSRALPSKIAPHIQKIAADPAQDVREAVPGALVALYTLDPSLLPSALKVLEALAADTESYVRLRVVNALSESIGNNIPLTPAMMALLRKLALDSNSSVKYAANETIVEYERVARFNALQKALPAIDVIERNVKPALTDEALARQVLIDAATLSLTPDTAIQQRMADAIGQLGHAHAALAADAIDALGRMKDASHPPARAFAARNIGMIGVNNPAQAEHAVDTLALFGGDGDSDVITMMLAATGSIGAKHAAANDDARNVLEQFSHSSDSRLRKKAEFQLKLIPPSP